MVNSGDLCIPLTESLQPSAQVFGPPRIFIGEGQRTHVTKTLSLIALLSLLVVPAAHAVEPSATPKNAAQWCKAWKSGTQTEQLNLLFPGNAGFVATFTTKAANGLEKKNLIGRCVSLTAKKLAAAQAAAAAGPSLSKRCIADLARGGSAYANPGRCVSDKGRLIRP